MSVTELIEELNCIRRAILYGHDQLALHHPELHPSNAKSAENLYHYLILRSFDLRPYQDMLSDLGLSSLRTAEGYVLENLQNVITHLKRIADIAEINDRTSAYLSYRQSRDLLKDHTEALFGHLGIHNHNRIMVTLPTEAATDDSIISALVQNGMDVARINLSHDDIAIWLQMINHVRKVSQKHGKSIKIYMDLAGPKIRTGVLLGGAVKRTKNGSKLRVYQGLVLWLFKSKEAYRDTKEIKKEDPALTVSLPQIIDDVAVGESILFDDGMIHGRVVTKESHYCRVQIEACFKSKLGEEKGINLPNTQLNLPALTAEDLEILPFAYTHADIIGYSFVRHQADVALLYNEIAKLGNKELGIVFKIENQEAFENFPNILFKGMQRKGIGVMIARGDLAVELGFERIAEVQKELMWLCEAAHLPVIWATQVLETLAKKGIPTRAEISDAAEGARAECVMLNKGPHILQAITTLRTILDKMDGHMSKKKDSLRALNIAKKYTQVQSQNPNGNR